MTVTQYLYRSNQAHNIPDLGRKFRRGRGGWLHASIRELHAPRLDSLAHVRTLSQRRTNDFPRVFALPVKFHTDFYGTIVERLSRRGITLSWMMSE